MAQPGDPASRAVQRVRDLHPAGPDGTCTDCGQLWPCNTINAVDGNHETDVVTALNEVKTVIAAAEATPPDDVRQLYRTLRKKLDDLDPPKPPTPDPGGGPGGGIGQEPPLDQGPGRR